MPRRPRINLAGYPQHVVQRGHNREACFFAAKKYGCDIHAYALITNHVHLLMTPIVPMRFRASCNPWGGAMPNM